ncbi:BON domain-containing protein [Bosea sp. 685]|uniref:BON domain-containing protein n=1 Tax=Bosea sp. 685 TaxID=3080057 RepID=UPI0028934B55|nr:BON domain-containing protein [Bosea sp. 685]WNJ93531.1 BON domain-containing protein [Bosea sp. 685]
MSHDTELQKSVLAELSWEPSISSAHIGVTADNGVVSLSGHVESFMEKHAAESAARRVKGVKAVAEEIEVRLPFHVKRADDEIAAAAVNRLSWDVSIPKDTVKVTVDQGWVTLSGQVEWHYQKDAAELDIRGLFGVLGVSSQITIKPQVDTANLSDQITHALHRSWFFDPKTVWVNATGGKVRLTGTVHSWHDRQVAGDTAWAAPGTTAVDNEIAVI